MNESTYPPRFQFDLPYWFPPAHFGWRYETLKDKRHYIEWLLASHSKHQTGKPIVAAMFNSTDQLVGIGVDMSETQSSLLHAPIMAIMVAEAEFGRLISEAGQCMMITAGDVCIGCVQLLSEIKNIRRVPRFAHLQRR